MICCDVCEAVFITYRKLKGCGGFVWLVEKQTCSYHLKVQVSQVLSGVREVTTTLTIHPSIYINSKQS